VGLHGCIQWERVESDDERRLRTVSRIARERPKVSPDFEEKKGYWNATALLWG